MISAIDIGTNTILMATVEEGPDGELRVIGDEHAIARMGRGVDASRMIPQESIDRVEKLLRRYRDIAGAYGSDRIVAFGTSALRDARNRDELIATMRERVGIEIDVLSGDEEARFTYRGALVGLGVDGPSAVLDIGGGSTELALGDGREVDTAISLDIGAVRITERFLDTCPPTDDAITRARAWAAVEVGRYPVLPGTTRLIGVAGTVTTLGAIALGMERFDAQELNGEVIALERIDEIAERLSRMTLAQLTAIPQIASGRADIIVGGAIVLQTAMRRLTADAITVSTRGVRYGVALAALRFAKANVKR